jgi:hypothetical protein
MRVDCLLLRLSPCLAEVSGGRGDDGGGVGGGSDLGGGPGEEKQFKVFDPGGGL